MLESDAVSRLIHSWSEVYFLTISAIAVCVSLSAGRVTSGCAVQGDVPLRLLVPAKPRVSLGTATIRGAAATARRGAARRMVRAKEAIVFCVGGGGG